MYDLDGDNPRRPERPSPAQPAPHRSLLPVILVLVPTMLLVAGVIAFTGVAGLLVLAVISSVPLFIALHYLAWGYWLKRSIRDAEADEADKADDA